MLSSRLRDYVPEPEAVIYGCRPLVPYIPGWHDQPAADGHFHAPEWVGKPVDRNFPPELCPACHGAIGRMRVAAYCELCGSLSYANEGKAPSAGVERRGRPRADQGHPDACRKRGPVVLSERERRRVWDGCRGDGFSSAEELDERVKAGREWLTAIGQEPDYGIELDRRGNVVGRADPPADAFEPAA